MKAGLHNHLGPGVRICWLSPLPRLGGSSLNANGRFRPASMVEVRSFVRNRSATSVSKSKAKEETRQRLLPEEVLIASASKFPLSKKETAALLGADAVSKENAFEKYFDNGSALAQSSFVATKLKDIGVTDALQRDRLVAQFAGKVIRDELPYMRLPVAVEAWLGKKNMERFLLPALYEFVLQEAKDLVANSDMSNIQTLMKFSDLRLPTEWYPQARQLKRNIILHVGPTNSGKTYSALQRLQNATTGIYAGPLRLLAHEVYERLNTAGSACNLLTGEERRVSDGVEKWSCTVEMTPLGKEFDVAVVDEIQMIGDEQRGWAWTQALLGIRAKEIHLCGEATVLPLVARICELTGDTMTVNKYERLTKLSIEKRGFSGSFSNIKPGDCVVTFSRKNIFALRKKIESFGNVKCAVIYGGLPPEVRSEQAKLFNAAASGYDCLVASDAIGMGLNLNIRRVIFESLQKFDGKEISPLTISQIKQIAGRGGRFRTQYNEGYVCTFQNGDMFRLRQALAVESPLPIPSAGLYPTLEQMERFAQEMPPGTTFSALLDKFEELGRLDGDYFLCNLGQQKKAADVIEAVELSLADRYTLVASPSNPDDEFITSAFIRFANAISEGEEVQLADLVTLPTEPVATSEKLRKLESTHKVIVLYIWLSFRFPTTFPGTESAAHLKQECETLITSSLDAFHDAKVIARLERRSYHKLKPLSKRAVDPSVVLTTKSRTGLTYNGLDVPEPAKPLEEVLVLEAKEKRRKDLKRAVMEHNRDHKRQAAELREQREKEKALMQLKKEWGRREEEIVEGVSKGGIGGAADWEDVLMENGRSVVPSSFDGKTKSEDYSSKGSVKNWRENRRSFTDGKVNDWRRYEDRGSNQFTKGVNREGGKWRE